MNFEQAQKQYSENPTKEKLHEIASKLLDEMTLKEKIRTLQGNAFRVTVKNFITKGRFITARLILRAVANVSAFLRAFHRLSSRYRYEKCTVSRFNASAVQVLTMN